MPRTAAASDPEPRPRLSRDAILDAARRIAVAEGLERLTMRRLGEELGADPTALYRHFRNKQDLLDELADRQFVTWPEVDLDAGWQEALRVQLRHARERYLVHADLAILMARQPDVTPGLRGLIERCLGILAAAGLTPEQAGPVYHLMEHHVVGTGLFGALSDAGDPRPAQAARREFALLDPDEYPHAVAAAPFLFPPSEAVFEWGNDLIIDAIARLIDRGDSPLPTPTDEDDRA